MTDVEDHADCLARSAGEGFLKLRPDFELAGGVFDSEQAEGDGVGRSGGSLILNADDWGRSRDITDRTYECAHHGSISSVSAMVWMADSERAAALARERGIDAGLHLNLTTPFSAPGIPELVARRQHEVASYLRRCRLAQVIFQPLLMRSFEYVVSAQVLEFQRLYGRAPARVDGHHHMHLCGNVLWGRLLPAGCMVRRNFSFQPGEKGSANRLYRKVVDCVLDRRHQLTDYFFSLSPLKPRSRLQRIFTLARKFVVELETHPIEPQQYQFLVSGEIFSAIGDVPIAPRFVVRSNARLHHES